MQKTSLFAQGSQKSCAPATNVGRASLRLLPFEGEMLVFAPQKHSTPPSQKEHQNHDQKRDKKALKKTWKKWSKNIQKSNQKSG